MFSNRQIVAAGSLSFDKIMVFNDRYEQLIEPKKLHVISLSVLIDDLKIRLGGTGGNIAYSLGLLGEKPIILGSVGPDGQEIVEHLAQVGVVTDQVHRSSLPTAVFSAIVDQNGCQVGGFYPGAMSDSTTLSFSKFAPDQTVAIVSPHDPTAMRRQMQECLETGIPVIYDIGFQVANCPVEDLQLGLRAATMLMVNDFELGMLAKRLGLTESAVIDQVEVTVVTLAEQGCVMYDRRSGRKQKLAVPAVAGVQLVDPTGAGDAFRAGFLYSLVRDRSLTDAARLGCVTASFAIEHHGGQEHHFSLQDLTKRYQQTYGVSCPQ